MNRLQSLLLVLGPALLAMLPGPAAASPATDAFAEACRQNPDFFSFAVENLDQMPDQHGVLCTCLVDRFAAYPDKDVVMLTGDVDNTATAEERAAYGDYTALELRARDTFDACVTEAGLGEGGPPTPRLADMTGFTASCEGSGGLLEVIGGPPEAAISHRATLCTCLADSFAPLITTADASVLGKDLDGTATDETRGAHPGYAALAETAGAVFDQCFRSLELPANP